MTTPLPPQPRPSRSNTDDSRHTAPLPRSRTLVSVSVAPNGDGGVTIAASTAAPIPEEVPVPPQGAVLGLYEPRSGQSHSTARVDGMGETLAEPSSDSSWWQSYGRRIGLALADLGPTAVQGIAPLAGSAGPHVNTAGISAQAIKVCYELYEQLVNRDPKKNLDKTKLGANVARLVSVALNTAAVAVGDQNPALRNALSGAATGLAFAGSTAEFVHDLHTETPRQRLSDLELGNPLVREMAPLQRGPRPVATVAGAGDNQPAGPWPPQPARSLTGPPATAAEARRGDLPKPSARPPALPQSGPPGLRRRATAAPGR